MIYGSEGDWLNQHVAVAESLRDAMLQQHRLIPQHIGLGGGSSVYDFSYYGLLRPDVLISCLMPGVDMAYVISSYAILCIVACAALTYVWLRKKGMQRKFSALGATLLLCSGSFFQFHHQVMFVNYMPFLLLALLGTDRLWQRGRSGLLTVSLTLIYLHSFYYAIACLCAVGLYGAHLALEAGGERHFGREAADGERCLGREAADGERPRHGFWGMAGRMARSVIISIAMAMVLLLPTGLAILSTAKDGGRFAGEALRAVDPAMKGLLYSTYSCGMTLIALYGLLHSLTVKGRRFLSAALLACMAVPAVSLALNGFLYAREKILIPFVPLLILLTAETLQAIWKKEEKAKLWLLALCLIPAPFEGRFLEWRKAVLLDAAGLALWALAVWAGGRWGGKAWRSAFLILLAAPLLTSISGNCEEDYITSGDMRWRRFTQEEIAQVATEPNYRFEAISDPLVNCNRTYGNVSRSSMYSSITNGEYNAFYYDAIGNAISINNRVALLPGKNICSNYFFGVRYLLCKKGQLPAGYAVLTEKDGYVIAENPDVLPIFYGTTQPPVTEEEWRTEPDEGDALGTRLLAEHLRQLCAGMKTELPVAVARMRIESSGKKPVAISLNGMKNKLSADSAPYPNRNRVFTYVMATDQAPGEWSQRRSGGEYEVTEFQYAVIQPEEWGSREVIPLEMEGEADGTAKDAESAEMAKDAKIGARLQSEVCRGTIQMPEDGWFVTSCPWKEGYRIWVDGTRIEPQKVNLSFVGFPLAAGQHTISIGYVAPGYEAGLAGTFLGIGAFALLLIWERRRAGRSAGMRQDGLQ